MPLGAAHTSGQIILAADINAIETAVNAKLDTTTASATFVPSTVIAASGDTSGATDYAAIQAALTAKKRVVLANPLGISVFYFNAEITVPAGATLQMQPAGVVYNTGSAQPHRLQRAGVWSGQSLSVQNGGALHNVVISGSLGAGTELGVHLYQCDVNGLFVFDHGGDNITNSGLGLRNRIWSCNGGGRGVVVDVSDSVWSNFYIAGNASSGIYCGTGVGALSWSTGKIEFNAGDNIGASGTGTLTFTNVVLDRSGGFAVNASNARVQLIGGEVARSYSGSAPAEGRAHFKLDAGATVTAVGTTFGHGKNDDGTGTDSPQYLVTGFDAGGTSALNLVGCDAKIGYTSTLRNDAYLGGITVAYSACRTVEDTSVHNSAELRFSAAGVASTPGGTFVATIPTGYSVATNSEGEMLRFLLTSFTSATGGHTGAQFDAVILRDGGAAQVYTSVTNPSGLGALFGTSASGVNVTAAVNTDASILTVTFTNTTANAQTIKIRQAA